MAMPASERVSVLDGRNGSDLYRQCSRAAPAAGRTIFRPTPREIDGLERAVISRNRTVRSLDALRSGWRVEVAGTVRNGRRFVYGNFLPVVEGEKVVPVRRPTIICDGGPRLFGAEMDVRTGRLTHYAGNGSR